MAACSLIGSLVHFYLFYGLVVGVGVTAIAIVAYASILPHWFVEKRGLASGIAVSGMGFGILLFVPLIQHFILEWGWRQGFMVLCILSLSVLLPVNTIFLRHKPRDLGLSPDGRPEIYVEKPGKNGRSSYKVAGMEFGCRGQNH